MATTNQVSILVSAVDEASKVFNKIQGSVNDFAKNNEETFKNMRNYGAVAFGAITALATKTAVAYADSQKQLARVDQTLKNIDYSKLKVGLDDVRKASSKFGAELQALSGISDEEASESFAKLFQRTKDVTKAQKLASLSADLAKAKNIDMASATNLVSMVLSGQGRALKQYGIELDDTKTPLQALGELQKIVGGQAEAFGKTLAGQTEILNQSFGDLQENIGSALTPALTQLLTTIQPIIQKFVDWAGQNPELLKNIILIGGAITGLVAVLGTLGLAIPAITAGLALISAPVVAIIAGVVALGLAWKTNFLGIQDITFAVFDAIKQYWATWGPEIIATFKFVWETIKTGVTTVFGWLQEFWAVWGSSIKEGFSNVWDTIKIVFKSAIDIISVVLVEGFNVMRGVMNIFKGFFTGEWSTMWTGIKQVFSATWTALKEILSIGLNTITEYIKTVFGVDIKQVFTDMWNNAKEWGGNMIQMFVDGIKEKVQALKDGIASIATTISDYLGFHSPTKKGPGSDADKWMPNLIKMLSSGLQAGTPKIEALAKTIAQKMSAIGQKVDMKGLTDGLRSASDKIKSAFSELDTKIDGSKEKIKGIKDEIKGLTDRLAELTQDRSKVGEEGRLEVANRALDIQKEIEQLKAGGITGDEQTKLQSLESEYALATASVSQEEMKLALMEREKSETQKILDKIVAKQLEIDKEIAKNQQLLAEKQAALVTEEAAYKKLVDAKIKMEKQYYSVFQEHIKGVQDGIQQAITLMNKLNSLKNGPLLGPAGARAVGGYTSPNTPYLVGERGPEIFMPTGSGRIIPNNEINGGGGGVTINISGVTISNGMELNDLTDKIKSVLYNEHKYARLGY